MISAVINVVTSTIDHLGYLGVVLLMLLESACIPIPSFVVMPFAGAVITMDPARGFNLYVLTFLGAFGNLLGSMLAYWAGAAGGRPFVHRYGKYLLIRKRDVDKGEEFFKKYGDATALVSRLIPVVRTFISLPAGIAGMNFTRFCIYTFVGALPFCYVLTYAGYKLGQHWKEVDIWLHKADLGVSAVLAVMFAFWLWHHLRPEADDEAAVTTN